LDGDGFILQVHGVFTRIRSGATLAALGGGAQIYTGGGVRRSIRNGYKSDGWKTLRVLASIYKSKRPSNTRMDKSALGGLSGRA
jgi:maltoporin